MYYASMSELELWQYFARNGVSKSRSLGRDFLWVRKVDFEPIREHFTEEYNIFHEGRSMRSRSLFSHTHAVEIGDYVCIHKDFGNLARFLPLGLLHLFFDVIPFQFAEKVLRRPLRELYGYPTDISP